MGEVTDYSQHHQQDPDQDRAEANAERDPAPGLRIAGRGLCAGEVARLKLTVDLRGEHNRRNSRRKTAKDRGENRKDQIIRHSLARRQDYALNRQRSRYSAWQQVSTALDAYRRIIGITRPALRTEHSLPPLDTSV